jgi:CRP/FNR family transcriptional regulator, nitrogen oxide reductase regulator
MVSRNNERPCPESRMTPAEMAALVGKLSPRLLDGLAPDDLIRVLKGATSQRFPRHSLIAHEGYPADKLFLLLDGLARTFTTTPKGEKIVLLWIPPGEASGGRALLSQPTNYLLSTEAITDSTAIVWERQVLLSLSKQCPRLIENALLIASDYLAAYRDFHVAASYDSAGQRVAQVLSNLAHKMGREELGGIAIEVTNEELANEANVSIFTISRLMSEWQQKGLLVKRRGRVVLGSAKELLQSTR